jgi:hypothetical protein
MESGHVSTPRTARYRLVMYRDSPFCLAFEAGMPLAGLALGAPSQDWPAAAAQRARGLPLRYVIYPGR